MLIRSEIVQGVLGDSTARKQVFHGLLAPVMQDIIAQKEHYTGIQITSQILEVLALLVTFAQLDHLLHLPVLVASTIPCGNRVSVVSVLLVISVQMLQPTSLIALRVTIAPMDRHSLFHVLKEATKTTLWVINWKIAKPARLACTVNLMVCLGLQACVQEAGFALVDHGKRSLLI